MIFTENEFPAGAAAPFEILHISDTHLAFADGRDDGRKLELSARRKKEFPEAADCAETAVSISNKENIPVMCTGDLMDFVSYENIDYVKKLTGSADWFVCAGNHEFSQYVGEAWEDEAYRNQSLAKVQAAYTNDIRFDSRVINGVKFVAVDNGYYMFDEYQLERLVKECEKGLPVVLMLHVPLYSREVYDIQINEKHSSDAGLMSVPEELLKPYSEYRYRQQKENDITRRAYEYILGCGNIKLILTGHLHYDHIVYLREDLPQVMTGITTIRKIRFV